MRIIQRQLKNIIESKFFKGKAIILIGARQVGKSTLYNEIIKNQTAPVLSLNCDEPEVRDMLTNINTSELRLLLGNNKIIVIDEAQQIPNVGMSLKKITDNFPDIQLLVTGSSSLELQNKLNEPLTGRKYEYNLYPISTKEIYETSGLIECKQLLEYRLIYGSYPDVINNSDEAKESIMNIANSYLYKDVLTLEDIRKPVVIQKLLVALALQIGSEVSYNEVAQTIGTDSKTVEKYIDILEKCYIVFRLNAFNRNIRNELKKSKKVFFYDNGIRNAIIQNFAPANLRNDMGALWENFFISERVKFNHYRGSYAQIYFWRTKLQQEIDYLEEEDGVFHGFEMKWNPKKANATPPDAFKETYPLSTWNVITPESYLESLI